MPYRATLSGDRQRLLDQLRFVDLARKVVGVGSVGTRCWVALFVGRDNADPLFLQIKEAERAVGEPFLGRSRVRQPGTAGGGGPAPHAGCERHLPRLGPGARGRRAHPRLLRAPAVGLEGVGRRRPARPEALGLYGEMCGWTLARAHARSGDAIAIASYLGRGGRFDAAMVEFAATYAEQNQRDFDVLAKAMADGRIQATVGV